MSPFVYVLVIYFSFTKYVLSAQAMRGEMGNKAGAVPVMREVTIFKRKTDN